MKQRSKCYFLAFLVFLLVLNSCSRPLDWPSSPLYVFEKSGQDTIQPSDRESALKEIVGHYAHYDVVLYEDTTTRTVMRTLIVSYGFTDFYLEDGRLMQADRFIHAEQKLSRKNARSSLSDCAVQAIKPRVQEVELFRKDGRWHIYRPESPSLLGIVGDPSKPLSDNPLDPKITDPDNDGHPGITVHISVGKFFSGDIYLIRREIYSDHLTLNLNGTLSGYVIDRSEQFVLGASKRILKQKSHNVQHPDKGLNPVLLIKIDPGINNASELMKIRDSIFPKEPEFRHHKK